MADNIPSGFVEACVVVGAAGDKLKQLLQARDKDLPLLDPEVLQVHAPPFVSKESSSDSPGHAPAFSRIQKRRSFMKKKRDRVTTPSRELAKGDGEPPATTVVASTTEDVSVPKDIDLIALPQLCFPEGLKISEECKEDSYHFLVFTDVFGNRTHGVVVQYHRHIQASQDGHGHQNGHWTSPKGPRLYTTYAICVISKYPYYNALRDCLSCLLIQLRTCRMVDFEERVKEFTAKLALVPIPPPGQLHVVFSLRPLQIFLPSREDKERPAVDLDLHLPFLCFRPQQLLEIITSILMEQRVVFVSSDWARLTLVAECFMRFIHPLHWQHPFVPILSHQMLDFLMAPTSYLMGCHAQHIEEVAAETDDLILIHIDEGIVSSSSADHHGLPETPWAARECFTRRVEGLQIHYDLEVCRLGAGTDVNDLRAQRRQWQHTLNTEIQRITLELIVNIFRDVHDHLNYEHRVFNSEEFLKCREPADQMFYKKVLDTHIFHSFLRDRLNKKMDSFSRMELKTRSDIHKLRTMMDVPRRPNMQEMARKCTTPENRLSRKLGMSLPNLAERAPMDSVRKTSLKKVTLNGVKAPQKPIKTFRLPEFPPPLSYVYVQNYYSDMISQLGKAMSCLGPEDSSLLARYHYMRGFVSYVAGKRLDALGDFQNLHKTDTDIFPVELVRALVDSLAADERSQAERRPELARLISRSKRDHEGERARPDNFATIKKFQLPRTHLQRDDFVRRIQESGIVKDLNTIHRLFDALTVGQQKQVDPEVFRFFYTIWKETEAEAQDVDLPTAVLEHLETNECVYKLSSSVKTSHGVGKIAMTQRRLFLLTDGRPGYVEITKFRDIEEVRISSAPFLLLRIPSLKIKSSLRKETFEANLKSECDLWAIMIKEMWAGRKMADEHKDPQYMQQALTNALLMDAVVGCLQSQKAIYAASKLAYFDKMKLEVPMMVPKTTAETLKHKINPSLDQTSPHAVDVLLYTPGQLGVSGMDGGGNPKLWCALSDGKVVVFDAASWSMQQNSVQVGSSQLNCMLGVNQQQLWIGSQDSVIYIINPRSMSCNKQLTEHRSEVTGLALEERADKYSQLVAYSCSAEGTVIVWDVSTLQVRKHFRLSCDRLQSLQVHNGWLWCCACDSILEVRRNGAVQRRVSLPQQNPRGSPSSTISHGSSLSSSLSRGSFSCFLLFDETEQLWSGCADADELCVWHCRDLTKPFHRIQLQDCAGVLCMIKVKNQIWVGCRGRSMGQARGKIYVVDTERHLVEKELVAHSDRVQALCSAEDRYVLSGAAREDGKIAIWKVE
ncbi:DENN domain-containing protein 3 isoform X2 [Alosa sapidissima]|uniref:DENN domain-containing protein 3 isoform X2 n=1 Tax=Alosa sapidissima TaxID=34773 RepID=UPI001C0A42DA|nr:DENN domain-containing protein 3 isoform X2 [Alosa sapidissima]